MTHTADKQVKFTYSVLCTVCFNAALQ